MQQSEQLFADAKTVIPGGVNSPVRAFKSVGGSPLFITKAQGAYLYDADNKAYIDYVGSWGPMIAGHANPEVIAATTAAIAQGLSYGAPTEIETLLAHKISELVPSIEKVRMVNSGTEATMSAIRLARGFTGRNKIIKFVGCYHGHADSLLVESGSGLLTLGIPSSAGVPESVVKDTLTAQFNSLSDVKQLFAEYGNDIAAIIVEPVAGNMNCILPDSDFLSGLREICDQHSSLLIFDEVMTGFRVGLHGAQGVYGVKPDLTTLGKIIGGGMPVGAFGGRADIMNHLAPLGPVYQAGTLSGNPVAMTAGLTTLNIISQKGFYQNLENLTSQLASGIEELGAKHGIPIKVQHIGAMFGIFFTDQEIIRNFDDSNACDINAFKQFYHAILKHGIYLGPSAFEASFISSAHSNAEIEATLEAFDKALQEIQP